MGKEQPKSFYDALYISGGAQGSYHKPYSECNYYSAWQTVVRRLTTLSPGNILDVGCGPGQFARMALDSLRPHPEYTGIDFSDTAIAMAKSTCPEAQFMALDITGEAILGMQYDCVVCLEVLEHITEDLRVLGNLKAGTPIIFSVPSYDSAGHVRHFQDEEAVGRRYDRHVAITSIDKSTVDRSESVLFIVTGTITSPSGHMA